MAHRIGGALLPHDISPGFQAQSRRFEEHGAKRYGAGPQPWVLSSLLPGLGPGARVLDVCTGTGQLARSLAAATTDLDPSSAVTGLDVTPGMLAVAKEQEAVAAAAVAGTAATPPPPIQWVLGDASSLPFSDNSFDLVTCRLAVHHFVVGDAPGYLAEMARVCSPGGRVAIVDIVAAEDRPGDAARRLRDELETLRDPTHVKVHSRSEIAELLRNAGLKVHCSAENGTGTMGKAVYPVPLSCEAWFDITATDPATRAVVRSHLNAEIAEAAMAVSNQSTKSTTPQPPSTHETGLRPYYDTNGDLMFFHDWAVVIGVAPL